MGKSFKRILLFSSLFPFFIPEIYGNQAFKHDNARKKISVIPFGESQESQRLFFNSQDAVLGNKDHLNSLLDALELNPAWDRKVFNEVHYSNEAYSAKIEFSWKGVPLCGYYANYYRFADKKPFIVGLIPTLGPEGLPEDSAELTWSDQDLSAELFKNHFSLGAESSVLSQKKCVYAMNHQWIPAWDLLVSDELGRHYQGIGDSTNVYEWNKLFFHIDGSITGYDKNPKDGTLVTETYPLKDTTMLDSTYFTTSPNGISRIASEDEVFNVDVTNANFPEVNVFLHASRMMTWFVANGFSWVGMPIQLQMHQVISGSVNNAIYLPPSSESGSPRVMIGDGDGKVLQNLALDGDVVSHELGHHVVFYYLKSTSQNENKDKDPTNLDHSLAIHEGLADTFTFARTGDPCLGDSICPEGLEVSACYMIGECLRSADQSITYRSEEYWSFGQFAHLKGQLVSGFLWDIRKGGAVDVPLWNKILVKSVQFLPQQAVYQDLITALLMADKDLNNQGYHCEILSKAKTRGFTEEVSRIGQELCGGPPPSGNATKTETSTTDKTEKTTLCGAVAGNHPGSGPGPQFPWWILVSLVLPLLRLKRPHSEKSQLGIKVKDS